METKLKFDKFISSKRVRNSSIERLREIDQFYSDRSRIIYSSSFRRLQQKAQVFSLESNSSIRTRLTRSIEVSDLGRTLANQIAYSLFEKNLISEENILNIVAIVENACLLHDIGNPPFGHFGEAAIKDWAKHHIYDSIPEQFKDQLDVPDSLLNQLIDDFREFDGNPQGFRIVTKLYTDYDEYSLNLTYATLLSIIKYPRTSGEKNSSLKKSGFFKTEEELVKNIYTEIELKLPQRYPWVYIMEAADDIAYCMSDIADGIEKGILTEEKFYDEFKIEWNNNYKTKPPCFFPAKKKLKGFNRDFSVPWSKKAMEEAAKYFIDNYENIYNGCADGLISKETEIGKALEIMRKVSKKILYTSFEAESIEITGYAVITGILNKYSSILKMSLDDFKSLIDNTIEGRDLEKRLFHFIGKRYLDAYKNGLKNGVKKYNKNDRDFFVNEWWLRVHLIIDHISGMTDEFALETYQMFEGINLMR